MIKQQQQQKKKNFVISQIDYNFLPPSSRRFLALDSLSFYRLKLKTENYEQIQKKKKKNEKNSFSTLLFQ